MKRNQPISPVRVSAAVLAVAVSGLVAPGARADPDAPSVRVDLGQIKLVRGAGPDVATWIATQPTPAPDGSGGGGVGWFSQDASAGGLTLHYGALDASSYRTGSPNAGHGGGVNRGTVWSPAYRVTSTGGSCAVSFDDSYGLDPAYPLPDAPRMSFSYSFDGASWAPPMPIAKVGASQPWTTFSAQIACAGQARLWLKWTFDTVHGDFNQGRGWNLRNLRLSGVAPPPVARGAVF